MAGPASLCFAIIPDDTYPRLIWHVRRRLCGVVRASRNNRVPQSPKIPRCQSFRKTRATDVRRSGRSSVSTSPSERTSQDHPNHVPPIRSLWTESVLTSSHADTLPSTQPVPPMSAALSGHRYLRLPRSARLRITRTMCHRFGRSGPNRCLRLPPSTHLPVTRATDVRRSGRSSVLTSPSHPTSPNHRSRNPSPAQPAPSRWTPYPTHVLPRIFRRMIETHNQLRQLT